MRPRRFIAIPVSLPRMGGREHRYIHEVAVQFQIFEREPPPQLYLLREQILEFAEALQNQAFYGNPLT